MLGIAGLRILAWDKAFRSRESVRMKGISRRVLKVLILLLIVVVAQLAGCGESPAPIRDNHGQPKNETEPKGTAPRYDLGRDEERGGHTLAKHVGRTDAELQERLDEERNISAASTWTDRETAETTIAEAMRAERGRIEAWTRRGTRRSNLALHYDAGRVVGRSLRRGYDQAVDCTSCVIVLRADGSDGFYVLTAYPEAE